MKAISILLIYSLVFAQVVSATPSNEDKDENNVRVVFAGIHFENIEPFIRDEITATLNSILSSNPNIELVGPEQVAEKVDEATIKNLLMNINEEALANLSEKIQTDFIFAGHLVNQSRDEQRIMLVGDIVRYDVGSKQLYKMEILKYYEDFGTETQRIKNFLIDSIAVPEKKASLNKVLLTFATILAVGLIALAFIKIEVRTGGEGDGPVDDGTGPPGFVN